MSKKKETIYVAMSGGVDSSVAAALLKKAGFDVVGVYMKCWSEGAACTSVDDERSARLAAAHLGIPFYSWNFIKEYKKRVADYLVEGYKKGITPNPDMMCNREIKFGLFFEKAMSLGADYIATGHYARLQRKGSRCALLKGVDDTKDQSYFLSFIKKETLPKVLFPVGDLTKKEVRKLAKKFGLPNAERRDSQGICFIGKVNFADFLSGYMPKKTGDIVNMEGKKIGTHAGLYYYTIGQRKGIKLSGGPYFVVKKDFKKNQLIVSNNESDLNENSLVLNDMNWLSEKPAKDMRVDAKIRYRQVSVPASLISAGDSFELKFEKPQRAVTSGQFAAIYKGEELLGGGVIV